MGGGSSAGRPSFTRSHTTSNSTLDQYVGNPEEKKKIFISYSMRNQAQVELLRHQIKDDRYDIEFVDNSLKNPVVNRSWRPVVGRKIENSDAVICMVGEDTHSRTAVSWEIQTAYDNDVPVIPVYVHRDKRVKLPKEIKYNQEEAINWNLDEIQYEVDNL